MDCVLTVLDIVLAQMNAEMRFDSDADYADHHMIHYRKWRDLGEEGRTLEKYRLYFELFHSFGKPVHEGTLQKNLYRGTNISYHIMELRKELDPRYLIYNLHAYPYYVLEQNLDLGAKVRVPSLWTRLSENPDIIPLQEYLSTAVVIESERNKVLALQGRSKELQIMQILIDQYDRDPSIFVPYTEIIERVWGEDTLNTNATSRSTFRMLLPKIKNITTDEVRYTLKSIQGLGRKLEVIPVE